MRPKLTYMAQFSLIKNATQINPYDAIFID